MWKIRFRIKDNPFAIFLFVIIIGIFTIILLFRNQIIMFNQPIYGSDYLYDNLKDRGSIFFLDKDNKKTLAAVNEIEYNFILSPFNIDDVEETYEHINHLIGIEKEHFFKLIKDRESQYKILKKRISKKEKKEIQKYIDRYNLNSLEFEKNIKRYYPFNELAAQVLGFVSVDNTSKTRGQYGIEDSYDDILNHSSVKVEKNDTENIIINYPSDIVLTIDRNVQNELEKQLAITKQKWNSQLVGGIVMEPETGKIVAMGINPSFDLNDFGSVSDYSVFNNSNVESVYEVGSVFKAITIAIGIDSKSIKITDTYNDVGNIKVGKEIISNFDGRARGPDTSIKTILSQSLNTGAVHVLQKIGISTFKDYFDKFSFNGFTRIELPKEVSSLVGNLETGREIEYATASFGQGIALTPISSIRALATLANGGILVQPYIIDQIIQRRNLDLILRNSNVKRERKRIFKESTTKDVTKLLVNAFDNSPISATFNNKYYSVAAKTGTAQLVNKNTGSYYDDKHLHSFFGYFPASKPEFIIYLYSVDPKTKLLSSSTMADPFNNLANYIISYYDIEVDR